MKQLGIVAEEQVKQHDTAVAVRETGRDSAGVVLEKPRADLPDNRQAVEERVTLHDSGHVPVLEATARAPGFSSWTRYALAEAGFEQRSRLNSWVTGSGSVPAVWRASWMNRACVSAGYRHGRTSLTSPAARGHGQQDSAGQRCSRPERASCTCSSASVEPASERQHLSPTATCLLHLPCCYVGLPAIGSHPAVRQSWMERGQPRAYRASSAPSTTGHHRHSGTRSDRLL